MDFPEFCMELEAHFWGACSKLIGIKLLQLDLILGKNPFRSFRPVRHLKFSGSFGHHVHLGFHLLMMLLGASRIPPCGCVVKP
ncbi:hypothetical protein Tco_1547147 [Tanacetum coccineum]